MGTLKNILKKTFLPVQNMSLRSYVINFTMDTIRLLLGLRDPSIPPTRLMFDGFPSVSAFKRNGEEYLGFFLKICNLKPNEDVLDVGCGIGRKTIPLTRYLDNNGRYE